MRAGFLGIGILAVGAVAAVAGCGGRDAVWDVPINVTDARAVGLGSSVAVVDDPAHRILLLGSDQAHDVRVQSVGVGKHVSTAVASPDKTRLFVLTQGDAPVSRPQDELPSLAVIDDPAGGSQAQVAVRHFGNLLSGLAIDPHPHGRWLVLYPQPQKDSAFVENPNELLLVDLNDPSAEPRPITLRSTGGYPQHFAFTDPMKILPEAAVAGQSIMRQLLLVETDRDVAIIDLDNPNHPPPITVQMPSASASGIPSAPAQVVFDPGSTDPQDTSDTSTGRIGIRLSGSTNVLAFRLARPGDEEHENDFTVTANLTELGGQATDIRFVRTNHGTRLAALVPSVPKAMLIDTDTSLKIDVPLSTAYQNLSVVTDGVGAEDAGSDVAMLWGGYAQADLPGVAFWTTAEEAAFRSTENVELSASVQGVLDVSHDHPELKILQTSGVNPFYVLDLRARTATPITWGSGTVGDGFELSSDGQRLWVYRHDDKNLGLVRLEGLTTQSITLERSLGAAFEIENPDGSSRSLIALHTDGALGATVFDALDPAIATARSYASLLLEGTAR